MLEAEGSVWKMLQERRQRPDEAEREISEIWSIQGPDIPLKFWDEDSSHTGNEGSPPKLRTPCQWPVRWFQDLSPATALNWNLIIICSNQEACSFPDPAERNTVLWISWFQSWETKLSSSMSSLDFWKLLRVLFKSPKWKWSHSVMSDFCDPMALGFSRQEYWSGLPFPSPENLPDPGIEPRSPALQADSLLSEPPGAPFHQYFCQKTYQRKSEKGSWLTFLPLIWQQHLASKQQVSIFSLDCSWPGSTFQDFWYS